MPAQLVGPGFETGIVTRDGERLVAFYRDILGMTELTPIPIPGFCTVLRLGCGGTILRIVVPEAPPAHDHAGGQFMGATGLRYLFMEIANVEDVVAAVRAAGCGVPVPPWEIRPGRIVCQVQDPDGNHVELVQVTPVAES